MYFWDFFVGMSIVNNFYSYVKLLRLLYDHGYLIEYVYSLIIIFFYH